MNNDSKLGDRYENYLSVGDKVGIGNINNEHQWKYENSQIFANVIYVEE